MLPTHETLRKRKEKLVREPAVLFDFFFFPLSSFFSHHFAPVPKKIYPPCPLQNPANPRGNFPASVSCVPTTRDNRENSHVGKQSARFKMRTISRLSLGYFPHLSFATFKKLIRKGTAKNIIVRQTMGRSATLSTLPTRDDDDDDATRRTPLREGEHAPETRYEDARDHQSRE